MIFEENKAKEVKIAYIGGGSRGWAWGLMSDLAANEDMSGDVYLYDIDFEAAEANEIIGNKYKDCKDTKSQWNYYAAKTPKEALSGADFVVISILPGTFDEMESDVHTPEKYGIYQSVGDTTGPGGIVRAMRTIPMFEEIANYVKEYCPNAWVINYTNPMTLCVKALYQTFPEIKAFGCCHEVFGTQRLLTWVVDEFLGKKATREEIKVNPVAVNHFTWLTSATYQGIDLFPYYAKYCEKYADGLPAKPDNNWMNNSFACAGKVTFDLFKRFGYISAAGDRHLAEFCPGKWYLESPKRVSEMKFGLTPVSWRKEDLENRLERSRKLVSGEAEVEIWKTGEEGVNQMRALLGLCDLITNVNIPNVGQIPNLPLGAVVETNAIFRTNELKPVLAGNIPNSIYPLVSKICGEQEALAEAIKNRDMDAIFSAFIGDPLVTCSTEDARKLFDEMVENTKAYLKDYNL